MALQLKLDPTNLEAGARRAEVALKGVKGEAVQVESAIDAMAREGAQDFARLTTRAQEFGREAGQVKTASTGMGFAAQNAAFQIGDMATQIAGGTSATRALAMQLPQLLGGFGVMGAVIGGAVAVLGALVPLLWESAGAAEEAAKANEAYGNSLDVLQSQFSAAKSLHGEYVEAVKAGNQELIAAIELEAQARQAQFNLDKIAQAEAAKAAEATLAAQRAAYQETIQRGLDLVASIAETKKAMESGDLNSSWSANVATLEAQQQLLEENVATMEAQKAALDKSSAEWAVIDAQVQVLNAKMEANGDLIEIVKNGLESGADAAGVLANTDMSSTIEKAASAATHLYENLFKAMGLLPRFDPLAAYNARETAMATGGMGRGQTQASGGPVFHRADGTVFDPNAPTGGGGGGGGTATIDDTREAYDRLLASLDPAVQRAEQMADAQETVNAAFAAGEISAAEQANALDLIAQKYSNAHDAMADLRDAGTSAIDGLIDGTLSLSDALKQMAQDLFFATMKAMMLKNVMGATSNMSIGGIIMQAFVPQMDAGGSIPMGGVAMVGERGPELVRATPGGAMVTGRVDTARAMQQAVDVRVTVSVDDDGKIKAMATKAARSGAAAAVDTVKRNLAGWNSLLATDGALA